MQSQEVYIRGVASRLKNSGLADRICSAKGEFTISYNQIPVSANDSKHRNIISRDAFYYRFLVDYLKFVIGLVAEPTARYRISLESKKLKMDQSAIELFRKGWEQAIQRYQTANGL